MRRDLIRQKYRILQDEEKPCGKFRVVVLHLPLQKVTSLYIDVRVKIIRVKET
jgi:hypothetical protein